jgi:hypothetical protein
VRTGRTILLALALPGLAAADAPEVVDAAAEPGKAGWRFRVTVRHDDTGWEHYADAWEVRAPDGTRLGLRELLHPHVDEQPFTRSLPGVRVPDSLGSVEIRAHDPVHGWGEPLTVKLPR